MDLGLTKKVGLITGGSRGIGRASALALASEGADIAIVARGEERLAATAAEIRGHGVRVHTIAADILDPTQAERIVAETVEALGGLDILVANAGGSVGARSLAESSTADWAATYGLNVLHAIGLLRAATAPMAKGGAGSAIFIASISGRAATASGAHYAAAKAGLIHAARSLAWELAPQKIRVNALSPGSILFPGGGWERTSRDRPDEFAAFERNEFPSGRLGKAEEIADVVAFLASPRSNWINAAEVPVDGGQRKPSMR